MADFSQQIRAQFPILEQQVNDKPLVYLDSAASSQKPKRVVDRILRYYNQEHSNIHRAAYFLANRATASYEAARETMAGFINAKSLKEINFTKGTTEGINLVANSYAAHFLDPNDVVLVSELEHHSNIVPWQLACNTSGAILKVIPISDKGEIDMVSFEKLLTENPVKLVSINHVSNALGTVNPITELVRIAHAHDAHVLIDGAQAAPHIKIDVQELNADFYAFSSHKMYGPTGIGVLYGKEALMETLPPYQAGGEMISQVSFNNTTFNNLPYKFEAGTPNICGAIAMAEAVDFLEEIGFETIHNHEQQLLKYAWNQLADINGFLPLGRPAKQSGAISFNFQSIHAYDLGVLLDKQGVAIRTGHHCCQPLMQRLGVEGSCRISFGLYNTTDEIDLFIEALKRSIKMLS